MQRKAIDILGVSTFSHAISTLPSIILDQKKTTDIRKKAILALKKHQKAENIRALIKVACELLDERDDELRRLALAGLIEKKKKVNDLLDRDLKGKNHKRKLYAAKVLGDIGISSDVPKLKILMETEAGNEISKIAAESALLLYFT